ncbi:MAG TPA: TIGR04282 family arsenosugar biosynthesis glycosyltransferase [Vicinamibacterales bacterium]|nr:TIGR04282 family arsenosugar biosynthesis glycosyltransferase [Vicinamibacterales bacterium]
MMRPVVAVMARAPSAFGKSRLIESLGVRDAEGLREALLRDTLDRLADIAVDKAVLYTPPHAVSEVQALIPFTGAVLPQRGDSLGDRMLAGIQDLLASGFDGVVLVGSDLPTLPATHVTGAVDALARSPNGLVLGPAEDGGYYLIGLNHPHSALFANIPWGTARVFSQTLTAAHSLGVPVTLLPTWYDVDTEADLRRVYDESERGDGTARHTQAWLASAPPGVRSRVTRAPR